MVLLEDDAGLDWDRKSPFIMTSAAQQAGRQAGSAADGLAKASYYHSPRSPHSLPDEPLACHQPLHSLSISLLFQAETPRGDREALGG